MILRDNFLAQRGHNKYLLELRQLSRNNRKNPTAAESLLWNMVLKKKILGYKFLRQKPINQFILDFYCSKLLLAIEIDGGYHLLSKNRDNGRDYILNSIGIKTIRYTNQDVLEKLEQVKNDILFKIKERKNEI